MHQIHFLPLALKIRMDFRGPDVADFVYHCHIPGHEDNGMMAIILVNPRH
jgi:FtsP/CotA-like multicopper oxidase with cupredoxin domain